MARYERGNEFWDISRDGVKITIVAGEIGTPGTTTVEEMASSKLAETRFNVLLNKQARAGFKLYKPPVEPVEPPSRLPPAPFVFDVRNPELERAILDDPENTSLYEVYGDWLQQQNDPRGKLIALEIGCRDKPFGDKHHAQKQRFVREHREYLFGPFGSDRARALSLSYQSGESSPDPARFLALGLGFVSRLQLLTGRLAATLDEVFGVPSCRFLTSIHIDAEPDDDDPDRVVADLQSALQTIARSAPKTLRHLEIGGNTALDDLEALKPRLSELRSFGLASIADRELAVGQRCLRALVNAKWPRLESLTLELLRGTCTIDHVAPLFAGHMPKLVGLTFRTTFDDAILDALVTSPLASQIERLTFEAPGGIDVDGTVGDPMAGVLLANRARFPNLRELGVPHLRVAPNVLKELAVFGQIHDASGQDRYETGAE